MIRQSIESEKCEDGSLKTLETNGITIAHEHAEDDDEPILTMQRTAIGGADSVLLIHVPACSAYIGRGPGHGWRWSLRWGDVVPIGVFVYVVFTALRASDLHSPLMHACTHTVGPLVHPNCDLNPDV
ncbi:hypothetical protein X801_07360 [Opisthorchis viverrini]|uniref:Uncharacterized protein n=1 Tax=Opisthorchis viverrini TaxID=6198 RepID=A0A1S8WQQ3_OPIVI|nr:hypothetical protein X801_07360 [Opisthorchis viverrini]